MKASGAIEAGRASQADLAAVARSGCLAATTGTSSHRLCRMQAASMQVACQEKKGSDARFPATKILGHGECHGVDPGTSSCRRSRSENTNFRKKSNHISS